MKWTHRYSSSSGLNTFPSSSNLVVTRVSKRVTGMFGYLLEGLAEDKT